MYNRFYKAILLIDICVTMRAARAVVVEAAAIAMPLHCTILLAMSEYLKMIQIVHRQNCR